MIAVTNNPVQIAIEAIDEKFVHADFLASCFRMDLRYVNNIKFSNFSFIGNLYKRKISFDCNLVATLWNAILSRKEFNRSLIKKFILKKEEEKILFLQYNYARKRLSEYFSKAQTRNLSIEDCNKAHRWAITMKDAYDSLVIANLGLVSYIAKNKFYNSPDWSDGFSGILRAVERFDVSRGFKFSTYACHAILKALYPKKKKEINVDFEYELKKKEFKRNIVLEEDLISLQDIMENNSAFLSEREIFVLSHCFGLQSKEQMTLEEIGKILQPPRNKERVRQIREEALGKIKDVFDGKYTNITASNERHDGGCSLAWANCS